MKKIKDLYIAKEKISNINKMEKKIDYEKWKKFIDTHKDYFIWNEDTEDGIFRKDNIDKIPDWAKKGILRSLNKTESYSEFNSEKKYYEIRICFIEELNVISITSQKRITLKHLKMLLNMANYLDALLLIDGKTVIDQQFIEELERKQ